MKANHFHLQPLQINANPQTLIAKNEEKIKSFDLSKPVFFLSSGIHDTVGLPTAVSQISVFFIHRGTAGQDA